MKFFRTCWTFNREKNAVLSWYFGRNLVSFFLAYRRFSELSHQISFISFLSFIYFSFLICLFYFGFVNVWNPNWLKNEKKILNKTYVLCVYLSIFRVNLSHFFFCSFLSFFQTNNKKTISCMVVFNAFLIFFVCLFLENEKKTELKLKYFTWNLIPI